VDERGPDLRRRRREETAGALREVAAAHLAEHGSAALSLRAVARDAGMAVSNVYRYFPSRDDLLTDLLVRAFDDHAAAVEAAAAPHRSAGDPAAALRAGLTAYRRWAHAHPAEFGLAYGAPVPGYHAPEGPTLRPGTRIGAFLIAVLADCRGRGLLDEGAVRARAAALTPAVAARLAVLRDDLGYGAPVELIALGLDAWVRLHGCVMMEVFGQLRYVAADDDAYFTELLAQELDRLGLP
jgi:AcrR family transcriptional regulator